MIHVKKSENFSNPEVTEYLVIKNKNIKVTRLNVIGVKLPLFFTQGEFLPGKWFGEDKNGFEQVFILKPIREADYNYDEWEIVEEMYDDEINQAWLADDKDYQYELQEVDYFLQHKFFDSLYYRFLPTPFWTYSEYDLEKLYNRITAKVRNHIFQGIEPFYYEHDRTVNWYLITDWDQPLTTAIIEDILSEVLYNNELYGTIHFISEDNSPEIINFYFSIRRQVYYEAQDLEARKQLTLF